METKGMVGWVIGLYILASILPGVISSFTDANTTGWSTTVKTIWGLIPIIVIAYVITRGE